MTDREKLIEIVKNSLKKNIGKSCKLAESIVDDIIGAGVIVPPVKHGHWIYDHWCEFKCSECGEYSNSKPYKGKENYCPNCGAKMGELEKALKEREENG